MNKALYGRKQARKSLLNTAMYRAVAQIGTVLGYVVMVRGMAEHDFGVFNLLYAILPVMSTVASLGLEQSLRRFQPEYLQSGNPSAAAWLVRFVSSTRFLINMLLIAVAYFAWNEFAPVFKLGPYQHEFVLFAFIIVLYFQANILTLALASHMLHQFSVGMTALLAVVKLLAYLAIIRFSTLTLANAIMADVLAYACFYAGLKLAYVRHCRREKIHSGDFKLEATERKRLWRYSFFNNFNDAGTLLLTTQSDNFFIAALMSPVSVGAYSFCTRLSHMVSRSMPTNMFQNVIQPMFFAISREDAATKLPRYFTFFIDVTLLLQLPIASCVAAYHEEIVRVLFAGKFIEYSWLLSVIFGFTTLNVIANPVALVAQHAEKTWAMLISKIFAVYNALAIVVLIPLIGIFGAAIATGTAQLFKNVFVWWYVRDSARWTNFLPVVTISALVWGGYIAICYTLKAALHLHPAANLALGLALACVALLIYMRTPALSVSDRELLSSIFHGRESRLLSWAGLMPARRDA